ncbi:uncharacterized protein LOC109818614 [Cajanus cajan]|uniref:uncharacterized protein LOC109818614 n=1 Tax=Cajanus cajan TaxID=3821 RepID=UPI00098DBD55|nr:uncharacterized protein LOC109818614 [Cajanus cajan]
MVSRPASNNSNKTQFQNRPIMAKRNSNAGAVSVKNKKRVWKNGPGAAPNKSRVQSKYPVSRASHTIRKTGPFQFRGRGHGVNGGRHMPSHSYGPAINKHKSGQIRTSQLNLRFKRKKVQKYERKKRPNETVYKTCDLCDVKCISKEDYMLHMTGYKHLSKLYKNDTYCELCGIDCQSFANYDDHLKGKRHLSIANPSPELTIIKCELCNVRCLSQDEYQSHITGKRHIGKLWFASEVIEQVVSQTVNLGLQTHYPPEINVLSNAINAQLEQGVDNPQLRYAQLLMTVLSKVSVPEPVRDTMAAQTPVPTSKAGPSYEPQLLQRQISSEITAHVKTENPIGETNELLPVITLGSNTEPGSSVSTQIEGGCSETKQQV